MRLKLEFLLWTFAPSKFLRVDQAKEEEEVGQAGKYTVVPLYKYIVQ